MRIGTVLKMGCEAAVFAGAVLATPCVALTADPFQLSSPTFRDGGLLKFEFVGNLASNPNCIGKNVSPALRWSHAPSATRSIAIVVYDPDGRNGIGVVHWIGYGIKPEIGGFGAGALSQPSVDYVGGKSSFAIGSYMGPCPPPNQTSHHYSFVAIATDLAPDALPAGLTRDELLAKLAGGHALGASGIVGLFRHP